MTGDASWSWGGAGGQPATGPDLFDPGAPRCDVVMSGSGGWRVKRSVSITAHTHTVAFTFCSEATSLPSSDAALFGVYNLWSSGGQKALNLAE